MNTSLTAELKEAIARRVRTGHYGNASDVMRTGLRALSREEMAGSYREWRAIEASLPQDPISRVVEDRIERPIRKERAAKRRDFGQWSHWLETTERSFGEFGGRGN